jgi:hypothetical protein
VSGTDKKRHAPALKSPFSLPKPCPGFEGEEGHDRVRHSLFMTAAAAALAAGLGQASAAPLSAGIAAAPAPAAAVEVQYWGGWGPPRVYDYDDEPPVYRRRYVEPEVEDVLPASDAIAIARSMGYRAISRPRLAGRVWVVETVGAAGQRARVTIHAYTGAPINIRELEAAGQRFPTPPVWSDERPRFGNAPPLQREGRLDPDALDRPERPARPAPNITARVVPVPTPRPNIDGDLTPRPQVAPPVPPVALPPATETPAAPPPAASLPRRVDPPAPPSPLSVQPAQPFTPPAATLPQAEQPQPSPPTAALPPQPEPAAPAPIAPQVEPAPPAVAAPEAPAPQAPAPSAALPQAVPDPVPAAPAAPTVDPSAVPAAPPVATEPPRTEATPPAETAQKPGESDGVLIDGRFLGPNGEQLPPTGGPTTTPGVRQVTPPPSN